VQSELVSTAGPDCERLRALTDEALEQPCFHRLSGAIRDPYCRIGRPSSGSMARPAGLCGYPAKLVPENANSGLTESSYYDPVVNRSYHDLARHYRRALTRVRRPWDKGRADQSRRRHAHDLGEIVDHVGLIGKSRRIGDVRPACSLTPRQPHTFDACNPGESLRTHAKHRLKAS